MGLNNAAMPMQERRK